MDLLQAADHVASRFNLSNDDLQRCAQKFVAELQTGLHRRTETVCQIPTYVGSVAHGTEKGFSLGVDIGGTNFRVCSVLLNGDSTYKSRQTKLTIPNNLMVTEKAATLFSFIAGQIKRFLYENHKEMLQLGKLLDLGLCFAFPVYQASINSGILLRWTKGFNIADAIGKDVALLLQNELDKLQLPVRVSAIVNDALGTIMARSYTLPVSMTRTSIGAIFGTGTNAVYLEQLSALTKEIGDYDTSLQEMFLSTEWGSLDNNLSVLPNTEYDTSVNEASMNRGDQMFEKRVSGMFLGELLRTAVENMYADPEVNMFLGCDANNDSPAFCRRWSVDASILSVAESDDTNDLRNLKDKIAADFNLSADRITGDEVKAVQRIAKAIGRRAARLAGAAIGAVILKSGRLHVNSSTLPVVSKQEGCVRKSTEANCEIKDTHLVDIGVDGSVIELYPNFEEYVREAIKTIDGIGTEGERRIRIGLAKDGSSIGTAIIALLAGQRQDATNEGDKE